MKLTLNLASRRYINQRLTKQLLLALVLLLVFIGALQFRQYLQGQQRLQILTSALTEMEQQLMALQGVQPQVLTSQQLERQRQEFNEAEALLQRDAFRWTTLFDRLEKRLPAGVSVRSFSPDYQKNRLEMTGVARQLEDLQQLLDNLHEESFAQVFLQNQSWVAVSDGAGGQRSALSFSIQLEGVF